MSCSVLMVTPRNSPGLMASVKSVLAQPELAELIVADCGAWPDVVARLQQMALTEPRLKVLHGQAMGFSAACNLAAKQATGEFLLLLSPGMLLPPGALAEVMKALNNTPGAVIGGCERAAATPRESLGIRHAHEVMAVPISFLCIRHTDYHRLFGLDEDFTARAAGLDFCARAHASGGKIITVPGLTVAQLPDDAAANWREARDVLRYQYRHFWKQHPSPWLPFSTIGVLLAWLFSSLRDEQGRIISRPSQRLMVLATGLADLPDTHDLQGKTVIVTGAASAIGLCVVRRMLAAGASVVAVSTEPTTFAHTRLSWIAPPSREAGFPAAGIAVHCAPLPLLLPDFERLMAAGVKRLVAFGSTTMYTHALSRSRNERLLAARLSGAEAEIASRSAGTELTWTILRPTLTYGTGLDSGIGRAFHFIRRFGFFPVYPPALGRRQPVHSDDVAHAALQALLSLATAGKSYNVSGGEILNCRQLVERLFECSRQPVRIISARLLPVIMRIGGLLGLRVSADTARRMNDDLIFFHDDAVRDFGFSPRKFLTGGLKDLEGF